MSSVSDPFEALAGRLAQHRGPRPGHGRTDHEPWRGIVEETPRIFATWIKDAWQRERRSGIPALVIDGRRVAIVTVARTYGQQWYFCCPGCGRRTAFLCLPPGQQAGCYRCCRLGYRSQRSRPGSAWGLLDAVFSRDGRVWLPVVDDPATPEIPGGMDLVASLRRQLEAAIASIVDRVRVEGPSDGTAAG